jgi:hypothetical protein
MIKLCTRGLDGEHFMRTFIDENPNFPAEVESNIRRSVLKAHLRRAQEFRIANAFDGKRIKSTRDKEYIPASLKAVFDNCTGKATTIEDKCTFLKLLRRVDNRQYLIKNQDFLVDYLLDHVMEPQKMTLSHLLEHVTQKLGIAVNLTTRTGWTPQTVTLYAVFFDVDNISNFDDLKIPSEFKPEQDYQDLDTNNLDLLIFLAKDLGVSGIYETIADHVISRDIGNHSFENVVPKLWPEMFLQNSKLESCYQNIRTNHDQNFQTFCTEGVDPIPEVCKEACSQVTDLQDEEKQILQFLEKAFNKRFPLARCRHNGIDQDNCFNAQYTRDDICYFSHSESCFIMEIHC